MPFRASQGGKGEGTSQGPVRASQGNSGPFQFSEYELLCFTLMYIILQVSHSLKIAQNWFCIQDLHNMDLIFQKKERLRDIQQERDGTIFVKLHS